MVPTTQIERIMRRADARHPMIEARKALLDLMIGMAITFLLLLLNLSINFVARLHRFFDDVSQERLVLNLVNVLTVWLALLLSVAFYRWIMASRRKSELEAVISGISPDTLIVVTPDRRISMCNQSVVRMFGHSVEQLIGKRTDFLYHDRRKHMLEPYEIHDVLEREGFHVGQATGVRSSGQEFPLEIITGTLPDRSGAVLLLRDVTQRVREDEERRRLQEQVTQRERMESLGILAGGIAHDFNNLLAGVLGNADLLLQTLEDTSPHREPVEEIIRASNRASVLCREMLAYSGRGDFHIEPLQLADIVRDMQQFMRQTVFRGIELHTELDDAAPAMEADLPQVRQILMNLVSNASDAIGDQTGTITVSTGYRECDAGFLQQCHFHGEARPGPFVFLRVRDTGKGMDECTQRRIFEPFFTTKISGHGLGLASVQGIVRGHRGALDLTSEKGKGSTFTVYFPATSKPVAPQPVPHTDASPRFGSGAGLIVDDEVAVVRLATRMLGKLGYDALSATNGRDALEILRTDPLRIQFVLLDMTMPIMNGREVFLEMRRIRHDLPIILSSGYGRDDVIALFKSENPSGFIQKPYQTVDLGRTIREALAAT